MDLIALSKKSHTEWRLIDEDNKIQQFQTLSLNSFFNTSGYELQNNQLPPVDKDQVKRLFFYSSECDNSEKCQRISSFLSHYFPEVKLFVADDYLAAAHGMCLHDEGIAVILTSAAKSCLYNGESIISRTLTEEQEGSGIYLGKQLVQYYIMDKMPEDLKMKFMSRYRPAGEEFEMNINEETLKEHQFLASLSPFLFHNQNHPFIAELLYNAFVLLFDKYVCVYPGYEKMKVHITGAVGFYFANIIREVAIDKQIQLHKVLESPIAGLTLFHSGELMEID